MARDEHCRRLWGSVYLTDDSGIGNPHLEADSDPVEGELFGDVLTRLLISDMRGRGMHVRAPVRATEDI